MKGKSVQKEKLVLLALISTILIFGFYSWYVYNRYIGVNPDIINDPGFWGKTFMILIPVAIVVQIIVHIIFAIINAAVTREEITDLTDERDKVIDLKAIRISHWIFTVGFMLSMGSQALGMQLWVMFVSLILSGFIASIVSEIAKIYYYQRGF